MSKFWFAISLVVGCAMASSANATPVAADAPFAGRDTSVRPGDDFFGYANGDWLRTTEIPPDRSNYGTFTQLQEVVDQRIRDLVQTAARSGSPPNSSARRVGDYFKSFMDEKTIEEKGLAPLRPWLDRIDSINSRTDLSRELGRTLRADVDVLNATHLHTPNVLGLWVAQDLDEPTRYLPFLLQGGLGMPDRDYYLQEDPRMADFRARYREHIAAVLKLAGQADAGPQAERVFALELKIARAHASRTDTEDVKKGDNHWSRGQLDRLAPGMDWSAYLDAAGLAKQAEFIAWQAQAITGISALVASEPVNTWKEYLRFHAIDHCSAYLPRAFVEEQFRFYETTLEGTPRMRERWKRAVEATDAALGQEVGRLYVEKYFGPRDKAAIETLVHNLIVAFDRRIERLSWMKPETRERARAKLRTLKVGVGYPDHWRDYSGLSVVAGEALGNFQRAELFELKRNLEKLGKPIDRGEWVMDPQLVNAVNLPVMNTLQFPAATLQPPFFDSGASAAANYGGIGATIGHEISHSFDDQGALFDANGRLQNWWTPEDFAHFAAAGKALVRQYDSYRPFPDSAVRGDQTLSENIADLGGVAVAYDAFRIALGEAEPAPVAGLTSDQQFFLGFAQTWRDKFREPALRQLIITNGHAPPQYRADTVRNLDPWYTAFDVERGQALYLAPSERVHIW